MMIVNRRMRIALILISLSSSDLLNSAAGIDIVRGHWSSSRTIGLSQRTVHARERTPVTVFLIFRRSVDPSKHKYRHILQASNIVLSYFLSSSCTFRFKQIFQLWTFSVT
jgi:hypothetical protein